MKNIKLLSPISSQRGIRSYTGFGITKGSGHGSGTSGSGVGDGLGIQSTFVIGLGRGSNGRTFRCYKEDSGQGSPLFNNNEL